MNAEHLVVMANQISQFFESQPNRDTAVDGVLTHLKKFWDPRMRDSIIAHAKAGGEGMRQLTKDAVTRLDADQIAKQKAKAAAAS
ncbi:MAG: formate dehydrogenase subunit delta [Betaproteobacteria bacterium]